MISRSISRRHSSTKPVQRQHSSSEGATAANSLESGNGPGSGNVKRTSLVKRECWNLTRDVLIHVFVCLSWGGHKVIFPRHIFF
jgi:hypothetical protein